MRNWVPAVRDQALVLAQPVDEFLRSDHLTRFVARVVGQLDVSPIPSNMETA